MRSKKLTTLLTLILIAGFVLPACQPEERIVEVTVPPEVVEVEVERTVEVEREVEVERVVEVEVPVDVPLGTLIVTADPEGPTILTDPADMPTSFNEAPMLAEMVAAGELPPVEERLPREPLVLQPLHEIGEYGGELSGAGLAPYLSSEVMNRPSGMDKLIFWDPTGTYHVPSVAKDWDHSEDGRELTFYLREGMRWSDGAPFTAADIEFWWEDVYLNEELWPARDAKLRTEGGEPTFEAIDEYTVRWTFQDPYWTILDVFAESYSSVSCGSVLAWLRSRGPYHPKHYATQFHADYADEASLQAAMDELEVDNWVMLYESKIDWARTPEMPVLAPWMTVQPMQTETHTLVRNPYYWAVDSAGNQLPYIDRWTIDYVADVEVLTLRTAAGEYTFQYRRLTHQSLPLLARMGQEANYTVYLDKAQMGALEQIQFNMSYALDDEIVKWNRNADFRRAVSMAIDRDQINEAFYYGLAHVGSPMPGMASPENPGEDPWRTLWHTYDPDQSRQLLDEIGLTEKDGDGYRLRTDGSGDTLVFELPISDIDPYPELYEMIAANLADVGIRVRTPTRGSGLLGDQRDTDETMWRLTYNWGASRIFMGTDAARFNFPAMLGTNMGADIARWFQTEGAEGTSPEFDPHLVEVLDLYREGLTATKEEQTEIAQEMWKILVDQVYAAGIVGGLSLWPRAVHNDVGNNPQGVCFEFHCRFPGLARLDTFYWRDPARRQ